MECGLTNFSIEGISYYFPQNREDISKYKEEFPDWDIDKIISKTGVRYRYLSEENETAVDMAVKAGEKFFEESNCKKDEIDGIILVTQSPDYVLPTSACLIQDRLGLPRKTLAFDINLGCSGFVNSLSVAAGLINSNVINNCLLVCSETYSKYINRDDRICRPLFSDAAAVTCIRKKGNFELGPFYFGCDGGKTENLIVKGRAGRKLLAGETDDLYMNGNQVLLFALDEVPKAVKQLLEKANKKIEDISLVVFHQASKIVLQGLTRKIKIDPGRVFSNIEEFGNTVSCTIPIALRDACDQGRIKSGDYVLLAGFGVGYSWGVTLIKWG